jgi:hypothetical protein
MYVLHTNQSEGKTRYVCTEFYTRFVAPIKTFDEQIHPDRDTKKSLISLRHKNKYVNYAMKTCGIIIKWPFQGPNLVFVDTYLQKLVTSKLYVAFSVLPVLEILICRTRKFVYLILVVWISINKNNRTWPILVLHVIWYLAWWAISSTILNCSENKKHFTHYLLEF